MVRSELSLSDNSVIINPVALRPISQLVNHYNLSVEQVKDEVLLLTSDNIRYLTRNRTCVENFQSMWQRFGPQSARDMMIPYVWQGKVPLPSEHFSV